MSPQLSTLVPDDEHWRAPLGEHLSQVPEEPEVHLSTEQVVPTEQLLVIPLHSPLGVGQVNSTIKPLAQKSV